MIDPKVQAKIDRDSKFIQIRAGIENLKRLEFIPEDVRKQIDEELPKALPVLKDMVKQQLYDLSIKLGTGAEAKTYTLRNGKQGPTVTIWQNMVVTSGVKESVFPLQKILDRIDKIDKIETLIAEVLTFKIFSLEDEDNKTVIATTPTT